MNPGAAEDMAHSSLRFGIGRFTTAAEIDYVVQHIVGTVKRLRDMRQVANYLDAKYFSDDRSIRKSVMGDGPRGN